jgi:hypothetical protein
MTIKRVILGLLTALAVLLLGQNLLSSWSQPQIQSRLQLYQTNLVLQAAELQADPTVASAQAALLGDKPLKAALEQYETVQKAAEKNLQHTEQLLEAATDSDDRKELEASIAKLQKLLVELNLNLGTLQSVQNNSTAAQTAWNRAIQQAGDNPQLEPLSKTAASLAGLWSNPPQVFPDVESRLKQNLTGWFRNRSLEKLYALQQRQTALQTLQAEEQPLARRAFNSLAIVAGVPALGFAIGLGILLFLLGQLIWRRKSALLNVGNLAPWNTPWDGEIVWQVLIVGFFFVGQVLLPIVLGLVQQVLRLELSDLGERGKAAYILANYGLLAAGGLGVLFWSIRAWLPLPDGWFRVSLRGRWWLWGLGGYVAALPLVVAVSLVNQQIWQGRGGSNQILPIALESKDGVAVAVFFATAAIAAPIFEEILFRGFLLPSLTRYMPVWGAIVLSSFLFAVAHLNLSEVLPLMTLGMVLGFVYARSRNLLASMLVHGLWNAGTLLSLVTLGQGGS